MGKRRADWDWNEEAEVYRCTDYLELRMLHVLACHGVARVYFGRLRSRRVSGKWKRFPSFFRWKKKLHHTVECY